MANHKKETKADKEARVLEDNVRVLRCGLYGYVYKGKVILKSADYKEVNSFCVFAKMCIRDNNKTSDFIIKAAANRVQKEQPLFIPNELPNTKGERIVIGGNNYESQIKVPTF